MNRRKASDARRKVLARRQSEHAETLRLNSSNVSHHRRRQDGCDFPVNDYTLRLTFSGTARENLHEALPALTRRVAEIQAENQDAYGQATWRRLLTVLKEYVSNVIEHNSGARGGLVVYIKVTVAPVTVVSVRDNGKPWSKEAALARYDPARAAATHRGSGLKLIEGLTERFVVSRVGRTHKFNCCVMVISADGSVK